MSPLEHRLALRDHQRGAPLRRNVIRAHEGLVTRDPYGGIFSPP